MIANSPVTEWTPVSFDPEDSTATATATVDDAQTETKELEKLSI